jgi:hypothetical protein
MPTNQKELPIWPVLVGVGGGSGLLIKAFKRIFQKQPELQAVVNAISEFVRPLELNPALDFRIIQDVTIGTSATDVPHTLNRDWRGWFVVSRTNGVVPYETTQSNPKLYLTLVAASSTTVDIYVF